ncbi:MAG: rhamnulokinase [Ktedonobacterales bacterium]|nr:rhamnulokinase [Ktedonobacterales bacterium]
MATRNVAAVDLGAESGRVMLARFDGQHLTLDEIYRFPNRPVMVRGHQFWNVLGLWEGILVGLSKARQVAGTLDSIGVDTWGVDYGLVDSQGLLLGQPYHYRDHRTDGVMERVFATVPRDDIYHRTGIQFLPFNTLYQLVAQRDTQPALLAAADRLLLLPDLFHSWLCGERVSERTNATTTQMWDATTGQWATDVLDALHLPTAFLPPIVGPGTPLGPLLPDLRASLGAARVAVPATHDTGSAIAATPVALPGGWGYISSGTWSLVGQEVDHPILNEAALAANFTNEGGIFGTTRFLKNVMGLWLLQECQRRWQAEGAALDYPTLMRLAEEAPPFVALIDPDDSRFLAPVDMPAAINAYLVEHEQAPLTTPGQFVRCIHESLVARYTLVFDQCARLTGKPVNGIHILGGGARNTPINQGLADAMGIPVLAGPIEATAVGNALMQLVALGDLHSLNDVRAIAQRQPTEVTPPHDANAHRWQAFIARLAALTKRIP